MGARIDRKTSWWCPVLLGLGFSTVHDANQVSLESVLPELTDRDRVVRFPELEFRLKPHSSYSRESKIPVDPEGWFVNPKKIGSTARDGEK
ncbi:hypothetical protein CA13_62040 [Planctomycetes bacterium CA13]|uniref:Uncharacterized protein n=1 Tax=Novipirellula herctigrandis TaxID=2527986 RepID=A0A5C5ZBN2_9BACT|nr:hypothetical protein CA13_62040 [Planctomycetes bacterium CA13]